MNDSAMEGSASNVTNKVSISSIPSALCEYFPILMISVKFFKICFIPFWKLMNCNKNLFLLSSPMSSSSTCSRNPGSMFYIKLTSLA